MNASTETSTAQGCICQGKGPALSEILRTILPTGKAGEHFSNGALEFLQGIRELLDQRIEAMSATPDRGTKLNVE